MQIKSFQNNLYISPQTKSEQNFKAGGKPIELEYILKKRAHLLPQRILEKVTALVESGQKNLPSLIELHKDTYAPLLACKTLNEAKELFPEFIEILPEVNFQRNSRYAREFKEKAGDNFALKMLQEIWANTKNLDDIAKEFGMLNRVTLEWPLKQIKFVSYPHNYKTLLKASDTEENKKIAAKTAAWNALHPDLMYARNRHAAQGCKTEEYRKAQSDRMKEYDKKHPERREKIITSLYETWANCPEIKEAMSEFAKKSDSYTRNILGKKMAHQTLTQIEERVRQSFYKRFWDAHPHLKTIFAEARKTKK